MNMMCSMVTGKFWDENCCPEQRIRVNKFGAALFFCRDLHNLTFLLIHLVVLSSWLSFHMS